MPCLAGKGSVCELIRSSLSSHSSRCVGAFTSPHVHTIRERIRVGDSLISRDALVRHAVSLEETFRNNSWLLFFDRILAVALLYFAEVGIDTLVLEVGIGGRYDSTNFFPHPAVVCVITSISYDHQALLGDTLEAIAEQKAGIIKKDSVVFSCASMPVGVLDTIARTAKLQNASLTLVQPANLDASGGGEAPSLTWALPDNVGLATAALMHAGLALTGMERVFWPCRFEELEVGEDHRIIVLDGAHNVDAIEKLLARGKERYPHSPMHVVFGAAMDKSLESMLCVLHNKAKLILVRAPHPRAASTSKLLELLSEKAKACIDLSTYKEDMAVEEGLQLALRLGAERGVTIVCGSLYVAARARQWLAHEHPHLFDDEDWVHQSDYKWEATAGDEAS